MLIWVNLDFVILILVQHVERLNDSCSGVRLTGCFYYKQWYSNCGSYEVIMFCHGVSCVLLYTEVRLSIGVVTITLLADFILSVRSSCQCFERTTPCGGSILNLQCMMLDLAAV